MAEVDSTNRRCRRRAGLVIVLVLGAMAVGAAFVPAGASAAECPADRCFEFTTNARGIYVLSIPAGGIAFLGGAELGDCKWQVKVEFSDGSPPEELEFDAAKAFVSSHQFPAPGVYLVDIHATEGVHEADQAKCPDLYIQAKVTYPTPPPPKEEEKPAPEGPGVQAPGGGSVPAATQTPSDATPQTDPDPYWQACGSGVRAHLVPCSRAKRVIRAARSLLARARLEKGATFTAARFSCRLRANGGVACRRGRQRVLGA
jgi:hypothetical protein